MIGRRPRLAYLLEALIVTLCAVLLANQFSAREERRQLGQDLARESAVNRGILERIEREQAMIRALLYQDRGR